MKYRKKKQYDDDDGRVIAPMNVDGMPWYDNSRKFGKPAGKTGGDGTEDGADGYDREYFELTEEEKREYRKETRAIIREILKRFMPIVLGGAAIFGLIIFIFWLVWR